MLQLAAGLLTMLAWSTFQFSRLQTHMWITTRRFDSNIGQDCVLRGHVKGWVTLNMTLSFHLTVCVTRPRKQSDVHYGQACGWDT